MKFSVIVPTYNRSEILKRCVGSLLAQDRPFGEYEVIIVDDSSTDGTLEYLKSLDDPKIKFFSMFHGGPAKARNLAARNASGEYLAFTDDDCLVPADWLLKLGEGLEKWPEAAAVGGYLEAANDVLANKIAAKLESWETHKVYKAGREEYLGGFESPTGGTNNIAYRSLVFKKLGGFDESFPDSAGEDADLKMRAVKAGYKFGYVPLKVTHLDAYSFTSFLARSFRYGVGSSYFEKKHFNKKDTTFNLLVRFFKSLINLSFSIILLDKIQIARYLRDIFMTYGRFKLLFRL